MITLNPSDLPQYSAKLICPYCFDVMIVIHNATWKTSSFDYHLKEIHKGEEKRKTKKSKDNIIPSFVGLNLKEKSLKDVDYGVQISGNRTTFFQ